MKILGRTNQVYDRNWFRLEPGVEEPAHLIEAIQNSAPKATVDISSSPALFGHLLAAHSGPVMASIGSEVEVAPSARVASDLIAGSIIQILSCIGRPHLEFLGIKIRRMMEDQQISGIMEALEAAREDGLIGNVVLVPSGPPLAVQAVWQFHDAFDAIILDSPGHPLEAMADQRRVGKIFETGIPDEYVLNRVRTSQEISEVLNIGQ